MITGLIIGAALTVAFFKRDKILDFVADEKKKYDERKEKSEEKKE